MKLNSRSSVVFLLLNLAVWAGAKAAVPELVPQTGHGDWVAEAVFSPDSSLLITGSADNTAILWDMRSGKQVQRFAGHSAPIRDVAWSGDGTLMATGSVDRSVRITEVATGKTVKVLRNNYGGAVDSVAFSPDGRRLLVAARGAGHGNAKATVEVWDTSRWTVVAAARAPSRNIGSAGFSKDARQVFVATQGGDSSDRSRLVVYEASSMRAIKDVRPSYQFSRAALSSDGTILVTAGGQSDPPTLWKFPELAKIKELPPRSEIASRLALSPDGKLVAVGDSAELALIDVDSGDAVWTMPARRKYGFGDNQLATFTRDGQYLLFGVTSELHLLDVARRAEVRAFGAASVGIRSLDVSRDGRSLAVGHTDGHCRVWDLERLRLTADYKCSDGWVESVRFTQDGRGLIAPDYTKKDVARFDIAAGRPDPLMTGLDGLVYDVDLSPDGAVLLAATSKGTVYRRSADGTVRTIQAHFRSPASEVVFFPDGARFLTVSFDGDVKLWDTAKPEAPIEFDTLNGTLHGAALSADGRRAAFGGEKYIGVRDVDSGKVVMHESVPHTILALAFSPDGRHLVGGGRGKEVFVWDLETGKYKVLGSHADHVTALAFTPDGRYLFSGSHDGILQVWDFAKRELVVRLIGAQDAQYIAATPDGYYTASPAAHPLVGFRVGERAYPFDQFDLVYNRPDIVLERLGYAKPGLVETYRKTLRKRLQRMGFKEPLAADELEMPEIRARLEPGAASTSERLAKLHVSASSPAGLGQINVFVNDVPIYGAGGLKVGNAARLDKTLELELSQGPNKVQVSVLNARGVESLRETFDVNYVGAAGKPDLYVLAVGVSSYRDKTYDLAYAAKDAQDLVKAMQGQQTRYGKVHVRLLTDKQVTQQSVGAARAFLAKSKSDDQVVAFFAGHGLLDDKLDYYFATHDVDFAAPATRGLGFDALEGLLDGIPARNKLLLMDTCHAGEVDKDELTVAPLLAGVQVKKDFRGLKAVSRQPGSLGPGGGIELANELFADLRRGSGAVVLSSAAGAEFALESERWKNGVFTFSLLDGLASRGADLDGDGAVRVSELRDYVRREVTKLTAGRQTPSFRRQNLANDFVLWGR